MTQNNVLMFFFSEDPSTDLIQVLIMTRWLCSQVKVYDIIAFQPAKQQVEKMHSPGKSIQSKLYIDPLLFTVSWYQAIIYPLHSYIPTEQVYWHHCFFLETHKMGPTKIDNYCGEVFTFFSLKQCKIDQLHILSM